MRPFLREEAEALARELKVRLYRTSVKEDLNVNQVFTYLSERYLAELRSWEDEFEPPRPVITTSE